MVTRVIHLGFEVRVELVMADGAPVSAQLTRHATDDLELSRGDIVWLRALTTRGLAAQPSVSSQSVQPAASTISASAA